MSNFFSPRRKNLIGQPPVWGGVQEGFSPGIEVNLTCEEEADYGAGR